MTTDATTLLIQRIKGQLSPNGAKALQSDIDQLNQFNTLITNAATYAQILGTAAGPIAQAASASALGSIASYSASVSSIVQSFTNAENAVAASTVQAAIAESAAAGAAMVSAGYAGAVAAIVIFFSFVLSALTSSDSSSETDTLQQIQNQLTDIENTVLAHYWEDTLRTIHSFWDSATGGVGTDLDNLANEGIRGVDVKHDVSNFHDHAMAFVNNLVPSKNPISGETYWERPVVQSQEFRPQGVPYWWPIFIPPGGFQLGPGWYGPQPEPQPGPPIGGSAQQMAADPRTALPFLLLGISSYLTIEVLLKVIENSQPKFDEFLTEFKGDLQEYATFLFSQYRLAVNGIVKSDLPSNSDASAFIYFHGLGWAAPWDSLSNAQKTFSGFPQDTAWPTAGYAWNGVYGAANKYPQYGAYQAGVPAPIPANLRIAAYGLDVPYGTNLATIPVPVSSSGCIIDIMDCGSVAAEIIQRCNSGLPCPVPPVQALPGPIPLTYFQQNTLSLWTLPTLHTKLILGTMARWKAIYLVNGYDKVWSFLQNLRALADLPPPPPMRLDQDGTMADGNWSARELCKLVSVAFVASNEFLPNGGTLATYWSSSPTTGNWVSGVSLFALTEYLDGIARGNWAAPANSTRPLGFRNRLAAAAVGPVVANPEP